MLQAKQKIAQLFTSGTMKLEYLVWKIKKKRLESLAHTG